MSRPVSLFISYAEKDKDLRDQLELHLAMLKRQKLIEAWTDRPLLAGQDFQGVIDARLEQADIVVLLLTTSFLSSSYCYEGEMSRAMELNKTGEIRVIPVLCRPCDLTGAPFATLVGLPSNQRPIVKWEDPDEAWTDVVKGLRQVVTLMKDRPPRQAAATAATQAATPSQPPDPIALLQQLAQLPAPVFEKVVFFCTVSGHVNRSDLAPQTVPQSQRAMELIQHFSARGTGLQAMAAAILQAWK